MSENSDDFKVIEVPEEVIAIARIFGLMRIADDGIVELTEKGRVYIHNWCKQQLCKSES